MREMAFTVFNDQIDSKDAINQTSSIVVRQIAQSRFQVNTSIYYAVFKGTTMCFFSSQAV